MTIARRPPLYLRPLLLAVVLASATGCGGDPTITLAEAQSAAAGQIRAAAAAVFPPGYTLQPLPPLPLNCTDFRDRATGRVQVGVTFWVDGVATTGNDAYFDAMHRWWDNHGWTSTANSRPGDMFTNAISGDGYLMSLRANAEAHLAIGATTPCLTGDGTARHLSPPPIPTASRQPTTAASDPRPMPGASPPGITGMTDLQRTPNAALPDLPDQHR
ncbi:hypothetical protein [Amycolatopsis australiensis]|uniref:hypothetical protein n=1 Tax=Amycolatopsis australiensis TaxID=546364 RepID=UPI001161015C|nr:hypothetical protein [Amycolatopsis australiensis]